MFWPGLRYRINHEISNNPHNICKHFCTFLRQQQQALVVMWQTFCRWIFSVAQDNDRHVENNVYKIDVTIFAWATSGSIIFHTTRTTRTCDWHQFEICWRTNLDIPFFMGFGHQHNLLQCKHGICEMRFNHHDGVTVPQTKLICNKFIGCTRTWRI